MFLKRDTRVQAVEVETDQGTLSLPAYDRVIVPWMREYRTWEPDVVAAIRALLEPGMTFLDIGAHVGYHTLLGATLVGSTGTVVALEPEPRNFALLERNLARAGTANVRALRAAAWDRPGRVVLTLSEDNSGDHRVDPKRRAQRGLRAPGIVLDDLLPPSIPVHVVKSDLQGTDHIAIRGMARRIAHSAPVILAEFWPEGIESIGDDPIEVLAAYLGFGFALSVIEDPTLASPSEPEAILRAARSAEGGFCTLLLRPRRPA